MCGGQFRVKDKQLQEHIPPQPQAIPLLLASEEADVWSTPTPPPQSTAIPAHRASNYSWTLDTYRAVMVFVQAQIDVFSQTA